MSARILVVEDDYLIREVIRTALQDEGYDVEVAEDGAIAMQYISSHAPDLVVLDLALPVISGLRVCEAIRSQASTAKVPILVVSAMASVSAVRSAYRAGANVYLDKPFDLSVLLDNVETLLNSDGHSVSGGDEPYFSSSASG
jgi:two-component system, OmpR family, response regulator RpaA